MLFTPDSVVLVHLGKPWTRTRKKKIENSYVETIKKNENRVKCIRGFSPSFCRLSIFLFLPVRLFSVIKISKQEAPSFH